MATSITQLDPDKLRQLSLGMTPIISPPSGAPSSASLPGIKPISATPTQPQAGGLSSNQTRLQKLQEQDQNPWGSANNHPGVLGKTAHVLSRIGNIVGDVADPAAMARIPGTDLNRQAQEQNLQKEINTQQSEADRANAEKSTADYQKGELANKSRELDIMENRPNKENTPDQQAIDAKMKETNPDTGKPYTAYEARVKLAQDIEDTKPEKTPTETPHTISMVGPDKKPYEYQFDPKGNYTDPNQGYGQWKKVGPAKPEANGGIIGTLTPLLGPNGQLMGTMNTKTGDIKPITNNPLTSGGEGGGPVATTGSGARLGNTERNQFATQYVKPSTDIEQNFQKFMSARRDYDAGAPTGAASMAALAQHLGSTFGSIKGAQMGEHMIQEHKDAIGMFDRLERYGQQLASGQQLSKSQWDDFQKLITNTRDIQWETSAREAARRGLPVDFLPADVHVQMSDSNGHSRYVRGDQVQGYLSQGAKIQ